MLEGNDKNSCLLVSFTLRCLNEAAGPHTRPQTREKGGGQQGWAPAWPYSSSCHSLPSFPRISLLPFVQQAQLRWPHAGSSWTPQPWTASCCQLQPRRPWRPLTQTDNTPHAPERRRFLTDGSSEKGHHFRLLPVVIESQVPDSRIQILDEAGLVARRRDGSPRLALRSLQAPCLLGQEPPPIQQFHKVKLKHRESIISRGPASPPC